ncbi:MULTISPECIES: hypothetical protein [unclassified Streptomyces]|uniref:hypothetical protein n=1 Tax=unclassified Streptomyces TaxID=2593676 RepID=UPI0008824530|nr:MULTISPECIES: hypothetical protein [unclassified Streptomyces]MCL8011509.1 hypothetical protein [Streptomyces sp. AS02]SDN53334.1 hypothetical protein SAMN04487981_105358 [Streptomyces sp. cf386]
MPRTTVDEEAINATAAKLNNAVSSTLVPQLSELQREVEALLGDGLVLAQTSPKLRESYTNFNTSVTQAVNNITEFAKQFQQIGQSVKDLDGQIAGGIPA